MNTKHRKILICREISKYYEEYIRSDLGNLKTFNIEPKGELTIVISEKLINKNTSQTLSESDKKSIKMMLNKLHQRNFRNSKWKSDISKRSLWILSKLKNENKLIFFFIGLILSGCVGVSSKGVFGTGVALFSTQEQLELK